MAEQAETRSVLYDFAGDRFRGLRTSAADAQKFKYANLAPLPRLRWKPRHDFDLAAIHTRVKLCTESVGLSSGRKTQQTRERRSISRGWLTRDFS